MKRFGWDELRAGPLLAVAMLSALGAASVLLVRDRSAPVRNWPLKSVAHRSLGAAVVGGTTPG